jgi:hypothetical protein
VWVDGEAQGGAFARPLNHAQKPAVLNGAPRSLVKT